jgi:hypothetical protein
MELSRIVAMVDGEGHILISKKWMTKIFVTGDILSFIFQGGGECFLSPFLASLSPRYKAN